MQRWALVGLWHLPGVAFKKENKHKDITEVVPFDAQKGTSWRRGCEWREFKKGRNKLEEGEK